MMPPASRARSRSSPSGLRRRGDARHSARDQNTAEDRVPPPWLSQDGVPLTEFIDNRRNERVGWSARRRGGMGPSPERRAIAAYLLRTPTTTNPTPAMSDRLLSIGEIGSVLFSL